MLIRFWDDVFDFSLNCTPSLHYHNYFHHDYYLVFTQLHWDKIEWSSHSHWPLLDVYNHQHTSFDNNYLSGIDLTHSWYLYIFGVELNFRQKQSSALIALSKSRCPLLWPLSNSQRIFARKYCNHSWYKWVKIISLQFIISLL